MVLYYNISYPSLLANKDPGASTNSFKWFIPDSWFLAPELNKLTLADFTIPNGGFSDDGEITLAIKRSQKLEKF